MYAFTGLGWKTSLVLAYWLGKLRQEWGKLSVGCFSMLGSITVMLNDEYFWKNPPGILEGQICV